MKARTPSLKLLSASTMALLVVMVAGYLMSERASAQRLPPPPSDPVLDAVQQVQRSIVGLQVNLDALQSGLDLQLAPMSVNFRWTPAVVASADVVTCRVVNISDVDKTIHIEVKTGNGSNHNDLMINLSPGAVTLWGTGIQDGSFHSKFTVIGGTRADIRGTISLRDRTTGHVVHFPAE